MPLTTSFIGFPLQLDFNELNFFGASSHVCSFRSLSFLREASVASHDPFCGGLQLGQPVLAVGGEGADPGVPHLFLTFVVL